MATERPNKMWSGRFRKPLNRTFEQWQHRWLPCTLLLACSALAPTIATAQTERSSDQQLKCSQQLIDKLEVESGRIRNWFKLQEFYRRYSVCGVEDAEVETGVDTAVVHMLMYKWASLAAANQLFLRDPEFKTFALAGLNITDSTDDLNRIDGLAAKDCAPGLHRLCRAIRTAIRDNK